MCLIQMDWIEKCDKLYLDVKTVLPKISALAPKTDE